MTCLDFERTVICPQVDRICDTSNTTLEYLTRLATLPLKGTRSYHLCGFGSCDGKLQIGIFLPISEEERELCEEAIISVSCSGNCLWARVAIETTFESLSRAHEFLPIFKVIRVLKLSNTVRPRRLELLVLGMMTYDVRVQLFDLRTVFIHATEIEIPHDCPSG